MIRYKIQIILKELFLQSRFALISIFLLPATFLLNLFKLNEPPWLIGENYGKCLQDNGYIFYKFCRKTYPLKPIYFISTKGSMDNDPFLKADENIIIHGSIKHIFYFLLADTLIYSHSQSDIGYIQLIKIFKRNCQKIFLQHGCIGLKKIDSTYRKNHNEMDIFIVTSYFEKNIVLKNFNFPEETIRITGLARYDNLNPYKKNKKKSILYMPTWRNWIFSVKTASSFIKGIEQLITNDDLLKILYENNIEFIFIIHNEMKKYLNHITIPSNILTYSNSPIQKHINQCSMLITDYSSVSWDFYYLQKPVLFYQFDQKEYIQKTGSYIDFDSELFGEVFLDSKSLITGIQRYIINNFSELSEYSKCRNLYFKYRDNNNCKRIFKVISSTP